MLTAINIKVKPLGKSLKWLNADYVGRTSAHRIIVKLKKAPQDLMKAVSQVLHVYHTMMQTGREEKEYVTPLLFIYYYDKRGQGKNIFRRYEQVYTAYLANHKHPRIRFIYCDTKFIRECRGGRYTTLGIL